MQPKFRVFNKELNRFLSKEEWFLDFDGNLMFFDLDHLEIVDKSLYIIQLFTGIQDKSGRDIYEGDIVKYLYKDNKYESGEVKWGIYSDGEYVERVDCFTVKNYPLSDLIHGAGYNYSTAGEVQRDSLEIIGNIIENPELIK